MTKTHEELIEVSGFIIDLFEDFLAEKGFDIKDFPNKERDEYADGDTEGLAIIFGSDYDSLENDIEEYLKGKLK